MTDEAIVVVGAGQAGFYAVQTLREKGFEGTLTLIGTENHPPYERPPLSKAVLAGSEDIKSTYFTTEDRLADIGVTFVKGHTVSAIAREDHEVVLDDGSRIPYAKLLIATGTRVRRLDVPGQEGAPIHYLRDIDECLALKAVLGPGRRLVVVGGGLIGLEIAATACELGCDVTVLEYADRLMARVVGPEVSEAFRRLHAGHGVDIRTGVALERFEPGGDGTRVVCADGTSFEADLVVVGIGAIPNVELAADAGLEVENGIVVDEYTRTSDPDIFAAGDVTSHFHPRYGRALRLETWKNAQDQGAAAARTMLGELVPYNETPWGWSNQFSVNLQFLGLPESWEGGVLRGEPDSGSFSVFYLKDGAVDAVTSVASPKDIAVARRLMMTGKPVDPAVLADPDADLRTLIR